ncbi:MAG TPA: Trp biosynthesis-associated membrane protein [Nocardioides sp.]|uniref:Trp biosynthesis-associated membrane protein n=1 Tax=Nocardioides sp. TaxID=35761 RepID=UPI002F40C727
MTGRRTERRRWFGPAVVLGVAGTGLAALAGGKPWGAPDGQAGSTLVDKSGGHVPLAAALGLVGLACWGVLLVTRGRLRRAVAALSALVAVGLVTTAVVGRSSALDSARNATVDLGRTPAGVHTTAWWYVALVAAVLALFSAAIAVRYVPDWPEMGKRYDAPTATTAAPDPADQENVDLWRAIDQGRDPTDTTDP